MSDLSERLRQWNSGPVVPRMLLDEAADEIERLRAALAWYGERAASLAATEWHRNPQYAEAIFVELSLDGGRRAGELVEPLALNPAQATTPPATEQQG